MPKNHGEKALMKEFIDICWQVKSDFRRKNDNFVVWQSAKQCGVNKGLQEEAIGALLLGLEACKVWKGDRSRQKMHSEMVTAREAARTKVYMPIFARLFREARDIAHHLSNTGVENLITQLFVGFLRHQRKEIDYRVLNPLLEALALILIDVADGDETQTIKENIRQRFIRFKKLSGNPRRLRTEFAEKQFLEVYSIFVKPRRIRTLEERRRRR